MTEKKGYFKSFAKSGFLLHAAFITSVLLTLLVANYEYGLFNMLFTQKRLFTYVLVIISVFAVVGVAYLLVSLKISHVTLADAVYLSLAVVGVAYAIYTAAALGNFNARRILFAVIVFAVGVALLIVRAVTFNKLAAKEQSITLNKVKSYFTRVINEFSLLGVVLAAGVTVCVAYLVLNVSFGKNLKDTTYLIIAACCLLPLIAYAIKGALNRNVNIFDALLLSGVISVPVVLLQVLLVAYSQMRLAVWATVFCAYLVLYLFRFARYSVTPCQEKPCKCALKGYYGEISKKHDPLLTLAIGGFIATVAITLLKGQAINDYLIKNGAFVFSLKGIPIMVVLAAAFLSLAFFALIPLIGVKKKNVFVGDFFLAICFTFVIFGFITYIAYPSPLYLYLLIAFAAYCVVMTVTRMAIT